MSVLSASRGRPPLKLNSSCSVLLVRAFSLAPGRLFTLGCAYLVLLSLFLSLLFLPPLCSPRFIPTGDLSPQGPLCLPTTSHRPRCHLPSSPSLPFPQFSAHRPLSLRAGGWPLLSLLPRSLLFICMSLAFSLGDLDPLSPAFLSSAFSRFFSSTFYSGFFPRASCDVMSLPTLHPFVLTLFLALMPLLSPFPSCLLVLSLSFFRFVHAQTMPPSHVWCVAPPPAVVLSFTCLGCGTWLWLHISILATPSYSFYPQGV